MYIRGLIPRNFTELAEAVPIGNTVDKRHYHTNLILSNENVDDNGTFETIYSSYYSNYSSIRTSIVATIVLLELNDGSEYRYSSRLSGSLL